MDMERMTKALGVFRKNLRVALKAQGKERVMGKAIEPPEGVDLLEGMDATPSELIAFLDYKSYWANSNLAAMNRMAAIGFGVEMGMHDWNSEMNSVQSVIESVRKGAGVSNLDRAISGLKRLDNSMTALSTMSSERDGGYEVNGRDMLETIESMYGWWFKRSKVELEATKAFLGASVSGNRSSISSAMLNLVKNAFSWVQEVDGPRIVRLDAESYEIHHDGWTDEDGTVYEPRTTTSHIFAVEDSGPGVPDEMRDKLFLPFVSGRRSRGIGLYLTKKHLESSYLTTILDEGRSQLGGARFLVGARKHLEPVPAPPPSARNELAAIGMGIAGMIEDGLQEDAIRNHGDVYGDIRREELRIRIDGALDADDDGILEACKAIDEALASLRSTAAPTP